jgi:mRNA interferase HigB
VRIIKVSALRLFWHSHVDAEASLRIWVDLTRAAIWRNFPEVRSTFRDADLVMVSSRRSVVVFNIAHNRYRLIAAVHYNRRIVYTLRILTHKEYDRDRWKKQL